MPPRGVLGKLSRDVATLMAQRGYDPIDHQIAMVQALHASLEARKPDGTKEVETFEQQLAVMKLIDKINAQLTPYVYAALKPLEVAEEPVEVMSETERLQRLAVLRAQVAAMEASKRGLPVGEA